MDRHELRLAVTVAGGRVHTVATLDGAALGEQDRPLPFGKDEVWSLVDLPDAPARLARLGERLSAAMFDGDVLDDVTELLAPGTVLDVVVEGDGPVHELPFELLRLADHRALSTVDGVRFTRAVTGVRIADHPPAPGPLKILVAVGAPEHTGMPALDVEAEMQAIVSVVGAVGAEVTILEVAGPGEIAEALRRDAYHVLHLSAHGSPYGVELEDRDGNAVDVRAEDLVRVLRRGGRPVPLIVLSSCGGAADADAGLAVTLLRHGADRVIAMQTSVTDKYATALLTRVYQALADGGTPVAAALAAARAELFEESAGEFAIPALFAASDGPLWNPAAAPVPLSNPTELPTGDGVRERLIGDLIGRRGLLRVITQTLRDEVIGAPLVSGVVLTGPGGIGKTALAGRVVTRLRDDVDDPWTIVVHTGVWDPNELVDADAMRTERILLVLDDFEQNLTAGGAAFTDPGFAAALAALCAAAERGKVLVTSRYPIPADVPLSRLEVPPLSDAELRRLLLRMPGLRDLAGEDLETVVRTVGGHPRLVEFVDALLHDGARLPDVAALLERLEATAQRTVSGATREAVAVGARDVLLAQLLDGLEPGAREALLQLSMSRVPMATEDLAFAVTGADPVPEEATAEHAAHLARLHDLTLARAGDDGTVVEPWLREALAPHRHERDARAAGPHRHERAARAAWRAVRAGRGEFRMLTEVVHHLGAVGQYDEIAEFAEEALPKLANEATVAAFLGELTPALPAGHPAYASLLHRERDALEAIGSTAAAAVKGAEAVALATEAAEATPDDRGAQVGLSVALDRQGRLLHRLGRLAEAREAYERALALDVRLAEAEPDDSTLRRNVAVSRLTVAAVALDDGELAGARAAVDESLRIRRAVAEERPDDGDALWDLALGLDTSAAVHTAAGRPDLALREREEALALWRRLAEAAPDNARVQALLFDNLNEVAGLMSDGLTDDDDPARFRDLAVEAAGIAARLCEAAPGDVGHQRRQVAAQWRLGDMDLAAGDVACAATHFTGALDAAQRNASTDPDDAGAQRDLSTALRRMADSYVANDQPEEVRGNLERSLEVAEALVHRHPRDGGGHREVAQARERLAAWLRDTGEPQEARALYRRALASWRRRAALDPEDTGARRAQAEVYTRIAELDEASGNADRARRQRRAAEEILAGPAATSAAR
ncbi:CHAT domain-containing protein [Dactylosporangium salmoneum]|uniref:CHAT domain-containing protein n=1 Tax=Dactylosporangium salmoneum TaxID=53361 RepID=A0ABN3I3G2_9ACTN